MLVLNNTVFIIISQKTWLEGAGLCCLTPLSFTLFSYILTISVNGPRKTTNPPHVTDKLY